MNELECHLEDVIPVSSGDELDAYKTRFKLFKRVKVGQTFENIEAMFDSSDTDETDTVDLRNGQSKNGTPRICSTDIYHQSPEEVRFGLKPVSSWVIKKFKFPEGLVHVKNPFTSKGQRYWMTKCLKDYIKPPYITNISNLESKVLAEKKDKTPPTTPLSPGPEYYKKLRWVTFGYHHNWDTKIYSEDHKCEFPPDLDELTRYMTGALGFPNYNPEAAIINYYMLDSTLSGHQDNSEENRVAPIFSISFGQSAVFLIGGPSKTIRPRALHLQSGDIVLMSGKSRESFHGVPKILKTDLEPWIIQEESEKAYSAQDRLESGEPNFKKSRIENSNSSDDHDHVEPLTEPVPTKEEVEWDEFLNDYASRCRINLNIRQKN